MPSRRHALGLATGGLAVILATSTAPARALPSDATSPVTRWAERHAVAIPDDPTRPGRDLSAVARATAGAQVIGLGEPGHMIGDVTTLQARYVRHLVTSAGVRALALEMDWTLGLLVNAYVQGVRDDLDAVLDRQEVIWQTAEVRGMLRWLRHYNDTHDDQVEVAGVEYFATGLAAYEAIESYVADHVPDRMPELQRYFRLLKPESDDIGAHLTAYMAITDKTPYLAAAVSLERLIRSIDGEGHEIAAHHAQQIHFWYEGFSLPLPDIPSYRDARAAENVRWVRRQSGARTVYWAASAHVTAASDVTITEPGQPDNNFASAGSHLERWYGDDYVPIGFTFDHGTYRTGGGDLVRLPPASRGWFEEPLGDVTAPCFVLDLRRGRPPAVRAWLDAPLRTRGLPEHGSASIAYGGSLGEWFDLIIHTQEVRPARPL